MTTYTTKDDDIPDEETTLLASSRRNLKDPRRPTPLPTFQIAILLFLQLSEPITSQCIYPFINQLISELDVTGGDERKVGYYAGLIESLFFVMEAATVLQWSRVSDYVGRKPILMMGLSGLCISMLLFGLARTFSTLVISRCLAGVLNGNIGVLKSMMGELTDSTNMAQGFALIPIVWSAGSTIGPFLGGTLSRPHERFPTVFSAPFWEQYPYFLPCASASCFTAISFLVTALFLKETVNTTKRPKMRSRSDSSDTLVCIGVAENHSPAISKPSAPKFNEGPVPLRELFVFRVLISIANYCLLAFLEIAFSALLPLFYATPIKYGGLGLSPPIIGLCLGSFGLANGVFQAFFFTKFVRLWGPKRMFIIGMVSLLPIFFIFPVIHLVARLWGLSPFVWVLVAFQLFVAVVVEMAYGCIFIFITSSAPNKRSLGATNGLSQTTVSIARAVGPAISTSLFAFSSEHNLLGGYAVYAVFFALSCTSMLFATYLPDDAWSREGEGDE